MAKAKVRDSVARRGLVFAIGIVLIAGWQLTHLHEVSPDRSYGFAYHLGYNSFCASVLWAVLYFGFLRRSGWGVGVVLFLTLLATGLAANYATPGPNKGQLQAFTHSLQRDYDNMRAGRTVQSAAPAAGPLGPLQAVMNQEMVDTAANHKNYLAEIADSGVLDLLKPDVMIRRPANAKARIAKARAIIAKYRDISAAQVVTVRAAIANGALADDLKAQTLKGFDEAAPRGKMMVAQIWDDESRLVDEIDAIDTLLARTRGTWFVRQHKFVFSDLRTLNAYNDHIVELQRLGRDEQATVQMVDQENRAQIEQMRQMSN
jgi:hypothetical protein